MATSHYKIIDKKTGKILSDGEACDLKHDLAKIIIEKAPDRESGNWELEHMHEDFLEFAPGIVRGYNLSVEIVMG